MPIRYYGALYPTPSPCPTVEPLRQGVYWRPEPAPTKQNVEAAMSADRPVSDDRPALA